MNRHKSTVDDKRKPHECNICSKTFTQTCNLWRHKQSVYYKLDHECDICGKIVTQACVVKKHKRNVHDKLRPHKCDICSKHLQTQVI